MKAPPRHRRGSRAFSLVELAIVVVIIGLLASMAIPRLSRGGSDAAGQADLTNLATLRRALLRFAAEHEGRFPGPTGAAAAAQLTQFSSLAGATSTSAGAGYPFGPYLLRIPAIQTGQHRGNSTILIDSVNSPPQAKIGTPGAWVYNPNTGEIIANAPGAVGGVTIEADASAIDD